MIPTDPYHRTLDYLRVSITDRCNLRCVYCMPAEGVAPKSHTDVLRFEQIVRFVAAAADMGFHKVRLTGGEPLVRKGVLDLVGMLAAVPGVDELALTTNGILLAPYAQPLAAAGLRRVNISLDTLDAVRFQRITRAGNLDAVWSGIRAAEAAGLTPLKINVVVIRGVNDDELPAFAALTRAHPWHIRFIEVMPLEGVADWGPGMPPVGERAVTTAEIRSRIEELGPLAPDPGPSGHGPARYYRLPGALGTVGFISPLSDHFCASCNRLRLTADGWLRGCLFSDVGVYVKPALDAGAALPELQGLIRRAVESKPEKRPADSKTGVAGPAMSMIGG